MVTISRLVKITGLFGEYRSLLQGSFAKETYTFKEPTHRSHPVSRPFGGSAAVWKFFEQGKLLTYKMCVYLLVCVSAAVGRGLRARNAADL